MDFIYLYAAMAAAFALAMTAALVLRSRPAVANWLAHGLSAAGCLLALAGAAFVFSAGPQAFTLPGDTLFGPVAVRADYLSAFFLAVIGTVGAAASVYAVAYCREYYGRRLGQMAALYAAFVLSMLAVVTVSHVVAFIVAWELMTVASFLLVAHEREKAASSRAAYVYFVMTHIGTAFIIVAFLLLVPPAGGMAFADLRAPAGWLRDAAFLCALIGFGTKAGIIPLHVWLPEAHPAAPTHVSAVMSGVMIKTAIYGMARFYLEFLGAGPVWWGAAVLVAAALSAVLGVLYALMQHDVKRLLAYHSVENIGIILLGMGGGLLFASKGLPGLAGLAWAAALFHVLNHAIFKSLLFMGAGAVLQTTHTRDIEHLGGLIRYMPYTAVFFLAGAVAISGLPPLNGFVSEWLTFQALFALPAALAGLTGKLAAAVLVSLLGLTGALAAACFVKVFAMIFLAKPRSTHVAEAKEASRLMLAPMGLLAALCLVLGVLPVPLIGLLTRTVAPFLGEAPAATLAAGDWYAVGFTAATAAGTMSPAALTALLLAGAAAAFAGYRLYGRASCAAGETWTCGIVPNARMEYTATGFSDPIRRAFRAVLLPKPDVVTEDGHRYFGRRMVFHVKITYVFTELIYRPASRGTVALAHFMKRLQTGSVQLYVGYIMAVTIAVLVWSTRW
jgi:hydrogenase-4 component B